MYGISDWTDEKCLVLDTAFFKAAKSREFTIAAFQEWKTTTHQIERAFIGKVIHQL